MAVKSLVSIWERLKFTLRDDVCSVCNLAPLVRPDNLICSACESVVMLRTASPMLEVSAGPMYAACGFPHRIKTMIYGLKFYQKEHYGYRLSEILTHYWQSLTHKEAKGWIVVPVPPHRHAQKCHLPLIARPFASHFGYDFMENGLRWQRHVQSQHTLSSRRRRRENIAGAFEIHPELQARIKPGSRVLVLDDIVTTGSTLTEAMQTIARANPEVTVVGLATSHVPFAVSRS